MKILYVAKHGSGGNDDEGAIAFALKELGHEVVCIPESIGENVLGFTGDFVLFHKWEDCNTLERLKVPAVFWYFDLVDCKDRGTESRSKRRISWMKSVIPLVRCGFCTDGDWVMRDNTGKLHHLLQGADERFIGHGNGSKAPPKLLIFVGNPYGGSKRVQHINSLRVSYRNNFTIIRGQYQRELADIIASANIVIAPESPVTDNYWSNRVYMTLGFGGFLLHPYAKKLSAHYRHKEEIVFYSSRQELTDRIEYYRFEHIARERIRKAALVRTEQEHLYRHRCIELINTVKGVM